MKLSRIIIIGGIVLVFLAAVLALVSLRDRILDKRKPQKKKLTIDEENVIMKKRGY